MEKKHIDKLVGLSKSFKELKITLQYCIDIYNLIETVLDNFSKFCECKSTYSEIEIHKICKPKKDDNLKKIIDLYLTLYTLQKDNNNNFFIKFTSYLIEEYIKIGLKFDDLLLIKKMLKETESSNNNIENIFHKNGQVLIINGKLKNMEIINFFQLNK